MIHRYLLAVFVSILSFQMNAQSQVRFAHISVNEGLSQSTVYAITQDHDGFLWFGTRGGGLNRYNGYEFQVMKNDPDDAFSLSDNEVISILEDSHGVLWVGTRKGGLNRYDRTRDTFTRFSFSNETSRNERIQSTVHIIFENSDGKLFVGLNNGIAEYNREEDSFKNVISDISEPVLGVTGICEDNAGNMYFSSYDRLIKYNASSEDTEFLYYTIDPYRDIGGRIIPMLFDSRENLWIATADGIKIVEISPKLRFREDSPLPEEIPESFSYVRSIRETSDGKLWFGTINGLYSFDYAEGHFAEYKSEPDDPYSLGRNSVYAIFEDMVGSLWIGTWSGVNMYDPRKYHFTHFQHQINDPNSLNFNYVSSFQEDKERIWIGTEDGGLNYMDKKSGRFRAYTYSEDDPESLRNNNVKTIYMDSNNNLWVGTMYGGLSLFNRETGRFTHFIEDQAVYDILELPHDILWIGTKSGLKEMDLTSRRVRNPGSQRTIDEILGKIFITQLFSGSDGLVWIGTMNDGLFRYDPDQGQLDSFSYHNNDTASLSSDYIITICEDNQSNIWIGTNNGLNLYRPQSSSFSRYGRNIGLGDNVINGLLSDDKDNLWIATNKGLYRYHHKSGNIAHFDYKDGLQSNEFSRAGCYKSSTGEMYFGGIEGFNVFSPDQIGRNMDKPRVVITDFKIHNLSVPQGEKNSPLVNHISDMEHITLTYKQSSFSFDFIVLNYLNPKENSYSYKLEGYEDNWSEPGTSRTATYMNLNAGHYTFRVRGSNNNRIWEEADTAIDIHIKRPFWSNPIAFLFYILLLIGLLFALVRIVQYRTEKENELIQEQVEKEGLREINRMRLQFFTNISHEFRTPLTLISGPLDKLMSSKYEYQKEYLYDLIKSNVNRMLRLVNQLMDFRKIENEKMPLRIKKGNMDELVCQIVLGFEDLANRKMIELKYEADSRLFRGTEQWFDEGIIDKVVYNLLSNAFKFTPEQGIIEVRLSLESHKAILIVEDTGKGITREKVTRIFERYYSESTENYVGTGIGLSLSKRLIDLHRGDILVKSEQGMGSTFVVSIPIGKDDFTFEEFQTDLDIQIDDRSSLDAEHLTIPLSNSVGESKLSGQTMLIVEDNSELSVYLSDHFSDYNTMVAENGRLGLEIAREKLPDIIISDIMMPEMDGLELCRMVKQDFLTSHIPVVLLTAKSAVEQKIEGLGIGADAYLDKPFDSEYLTVVVKNLLDQRRMLREKYLEYAETDADLDSDILTGPDKNFIEIVDETIQAHISDSEFSIEHLMKALNMSRSQVYRKFKQLVNKNPSEYMRIVRLKHAISLLKKREHNVNEIALLSGFGNVSYFITIFKKHYGMPPGKYMESNQP